jgi:threonyl-tRNA synthetase
LGWGEGGLKSLSSCDSFNEYADRIVNDLRGLMIRAERDPAPDTMGKKIRNASKQKIPNVLIVGEKEQQDGTITLRRHGIEEQLTMPVAEFRAWISEEISQRRLPAWFKKG